MGTKIRAVEAACKAREAVRGLAATLVAALAVAALAGCGGGGGSGTVTVTGKVVDGNGLLFASQTVLISSGTFKQSVVTDSNGAFSVPNVPKPYDATIVDTNHQYAIAYQGLTRTDPTLTSVISLVQNRFATLSGKLLGGSSPGTSGESTSFLFSSPQGLESFNGSTVDNFSLHIQWSGPTSTVGTLYALQIQSSTGLQGIPVAYPGYGVVSNVALQDQGTLAGQNVSLDAVTASTLSGTTSFPPEYTVSTKTLSLVLAPGVLFTLGNDFSTETSFSYATPSIPNTSIAIAVGANGASGDYIGAQMAGLAANATGVALSAPAASTLTAPADGATGVSLGTAFTWTAYPGGVHLLVVEASSANFFVFTAATTATIPDVASVGLPLPASTAFQWWVSALAPAASVDAVADGLGQFTSGSYTQGTSASRTATTGP